MYRSLLIGRTSVILACEPIDGDCTFTRVYIFLFRDRTVKKKTPKIRQEGI